MEATPHVFIWALLGGVLPALLWLWFWLKEDARHPEPKWLVASALFLGMLAVPVALVFEKAIEPFIASTTVLLVVWAALEELLKYAGAYIVSFRSVCLDKSRCLDEPVDPIIYMITAALGFAAIENVLFLLTPLFQGEPFVGIITGNLRFVGATVLHVIASASVGVAMAYSFYKPDRIKKIWLFIGLFTAVALHAAFNLSIILTKGKSIFFIFAFLWVIALLLLWIFEQVKRMRITTSAMNTEKMARVTEES